MAYTTINKSSEHFETKIWTGNGSSQNITGLNFQPDFVWMKDRDDASSHAITDAVRGNTKYLMSNDSYQEETETNRITSFNSDGYSLGSSAGVNQNGAGNVGWNWKANGAGSANTDGSINTTATSVNTTAGFSISKYTGTGSNATVGHGLGVVPKMIIIRRLNVTASWRIFHQAIGNTKNLRFNSTAGEQTSSTMWNNTSPTSTTFSLGSYDEVNGSSAPHIAYCFAEKTGYSKFGSYTGTSSEVFIYTGFKPKFILIKKTSEAASWHLFDTSRTVSNGGNQLNKILFPNLSNAEVDDAYNYVDAYSNGFRCFSGPSGQGTETNKNGQTFIYMAFGQSLVGSNGVTAKAR